MYGHNILIVFNVVGTYITIYYWQDDKMVDLIFTSESVETVSRTTSTRTKMITILKAIRLTRKATNGVGVDRPLLLKGKSKRSS